MNPESEGEQLDIAGHTVSSDSMPTGEYIKILPQSKQGKDDVIIGPLEIGAGRGQGSSEVGGRLDYKLGKLPPLRL